MHPFRRFGLEHAATVLLVAAIAALLSWAVRRRRGSSRRVEVAVRIVLAAFLAGGLGFALVDSLPLHGLEWLDILPLHFCDLAVLVAVWALASRQQTACEVLYFWGLTGTLIAMVTPDLDHGFPDTHCVSFFALHGGVAASAAVMAFGVGVRPRSRANLHVFWMTNVYAAAIAVIDLLANENYLYLRAKPSQPSILDWMGPWPWYVLAADALAFVLFWVLMVPFSKRSGRSVT
ncbi:MAG TPA: TIGR02206 family membrane protein [Methylomirabilota bacterium]|nr:TIGR02206 family membrane protein [Methylomirabilota bacterium]